MTRKSVGLLSAGFFLIVAAGCDHSSNTSSSSALDSSTGATISGSSSSPADAANILQGLEAWSSTGSKITGTMANQGTWDASLAFPGSGYYDGTVTHLPSGSQIVSGAVILGVIGTLALPSSNAGRDPAAAQITQQEEVTTYAGSGATPDLPAGYRDVPDILKDDEGGYTSDAGCSSHCTPNQPLTRAQHAAFVDCGTTQATVAARIADCAAQNRGATTWRGATQGIRGEASWKLVTRRGVGEEVWQDQRTGLIWSTGVLSDTWCLAAGSRQSDDPASYCNNGVYQNQAIPTSYCAETAGLSSAIGSENWGAGVYVSAKGGMGAGSAPKIRWRLPTKYDYQQADVDGVRSVMPDMGALGAGMWEWTATLGSSDRSQAVMFQSSYGNFSFQVRSSSEVIRCVGR